ncbi:hypothetical protein HC891_28100 [Candidatus Gracilibacteria bacterium]|nr:hypothetical protein [Candidatus Gracilibacteria bacterium]
MQQQATTQSTPVALAGQLAIDRMLIGHRAPSSGLADITVSKGGLPLPSDLPVSFLLEHNGRPVALPRTTAVQTGTFQVSFTTEQPEGMYKLTATLDDLSDTYSFYFALAPAGELVELNQLSADGMQIDTRRYPEIVTYFGIVSLDGDAARLSGDLDVEVYQDGERVENFAMQPVDTARDR